MMPNPASGLVLVERAENTVAQLMLLDAQGRVVLEQNIRDSEATMDISGLKSGVYLVRIAAPDKVDTKRLVIY